MKPGLDFEDSPERYPLWIAIPVDFILGFFLTYAFINSMGWI